MDQVLSDRLRDSEPLEQVASALSGGAIVVSADGQIVWMDESIRRRVNGGMRDLIASIDKDRMAVECSISTVEVTIDGEPSPICVIRELDGQKEPSRDLIAAIEAVMSDTSWFTRTIIEKLKAFRQVARKTSSSSDLDLLTEREREVLGLICEGQTDAEMSRALGLSQNTVRNHIASLYRKIGVNRRSAAIIWARERAITSQDALNLKGRRRPSSQNESHY
jgi:DNA-binding CsgD family transcriptional regulator